MAEDREVNTPSGVTEKLNLETVLYPEDGSPIDPKKLEAFAVEVLDRGVTYSRFQVELPPDVHGEWVPRDSEEIQRYLSLGFKLDDKFANRNAVKSQSGTHGNIIGDVVFMTCPKVWKDKLDAEKHKRFIALHGFKDKPQEMKAEEKAYAQAARTIEKDGIGHFETSTTTVAPASELQGGQKQW